MRALCPAKVNLHLEIGARRSDGYHELATIFQAIGLWDVLEGEAASDLSLACDVSGIPVGEENLVLRAARSLQERFGARGAGARLFLRKAIPAGGGLGGGSSDAAGALVLLARLWGIAAAEDELPELAAGLGSDVAFFLRGGTAIGTGRGERIEAAPALGKRTVVLGFPPFAIATAEVYGRLAQRRARSGTPLTPPAFGVTLRGLLTKSVRENDFGAVRNDLEEVVLEGWPELGRFRRELAAAGASLARVSGSGSTVFGLFDRDGDAASAERRLSSRFPEWRTTTVPTVETGVHVEG